MTQAGTHSAPRKPFFEYRQYLLERFGKVLYRVPIDLGFGCPHRNADGTGGCGYCGPDRARAPYLSAGMDPVAQAVAGIRRAGERHRADGYIAYFQAGTSTHAPIDILRARVEAVLETAPFPMLVFSTRPDCLPPEILDWLATLTARHEVWVELGLQTAHDRTLERIRRGHDFACSARAARELAQRGILPAAHVILGLPGESRRDFRDTAVRLSELPFRGLKMHNLHIVRGSEFEGLWRSGAIPVLDEHAYGEALMDFLRHIPADWPVMRLVSETPEGMLLAPKWWMSKAEFQHYIGRQMEERGWRQGDRTAGGREIRAPDTDPSPSLTRRVRPDRLALNRRRGHSELSHLLRAVDLARDPGSLPPAILAVGFGLGHLSLDALDVLPDRFGSGLLYYGLGMDPDVLQVRRDEYPEYDGVLTALAIHGTCRRTWGRISVHWGDPRRNILRVRGQVDLVLLEPDRPETCPMLFSIEFLRRLVALLSPGGALVSACPSAALRGALKRLGLHLGQARGQAPAHGGTVAARDPTAIRHPLDDLPQRLASVSLAGIPYRDPDLRWPRKRIIQHRGHVVQRMRARGMPAGVTEGTQHLGR
ncbi:MAG: TIGR01212 family radical SAM protein [Lentisphaeria bacterium]|nr:TIGR01212 family radical SAM protein [Lentisphaeria bacterium]